MSLLSYILLVPLITLGILLLLPASAARDPLALRPERSRSLCAQLRAVLCLLQRGRQHSV